MKRSFIREILESINKDTISFAGGLPDESLFPIEGLKRAGGIVFSKPECLQYSVSNGIPALRSRIAEHYTLTGVPTEADNILITTGSQQALYILARHFRKSPITIEEPSYMGAVNIFRMNDMDIMPVPLSCDGVDTDRFAESFAVSKLAYLIPDFHNPAGSCCSMEKRADIIVTAVKENGYIIEDAPYAELYFESRKESLLSFAPDRIFHLGSFSKTLSPALRIGWVRADKEIIRQLTVIKETIDLHSCGISQYILDEYLKDDKAFIEHLIILRSVYKEKMESFADALAGILPEFRFHKPEGGMFIYGSLEGVDTFELVHRCMAEGVVFVPGNQFYLDGRQTSEIRFNYTKAKSGQVDKGLNIIKQLTR